VIRPMEAPSREQREKAGKMLSDWLSCHRGRFPTDGDFAKAVGRSGSWLSKVLRGQIKAEPEPVKKIHELTGGDVPGSVIRPDLWQHPLAVPQLDEARP
jgi:hypothetical protein